ncbi:hypothetical protein BDP27DRAFT_1241315 [Rhodocollybia butyracea]|uniref:DUF6589 domain-containing protein n=1 Tax=Rhodocollybia butyracea TaxID=206335 RepID=A0A9P5TXQ4_9AGAR|nr:hypothetical protein BDP27DRAFT_1241315 [Rhodocollybia butyracea]
MNIRSLQCSQLQYLFGLYAWVTGTSKQTIEVLDAAGLSVSYPTIINTIGTMADDSIALASKLTYKPHILTYDNMDISSSQHVKQRPDTVSKVQSGCFCLIYGCHGVKDRRHMLLAPILENLRKVIPLKVRDIRPTRPQFLAYHHQTVINIIHVLGCNSKQFKFVISHPDIQHLSCRPLPGNLKTIFAALCATTIEEKTINGNLLNQENFYIEQMGYINSWTRHKVFTLGIAPLHACMNLAWGLQAKHYGSATTPGSLVYFFTLMEKKRLAGEKPDCHALTSALLQILDGILISCWKKECGYASLDEFADSHPGQAELKTIATTILNKYCTAFPETHNEDSQSIHPPATTDSIPPVPNLLVLIELMTTVSQGDFGRIKDLLPDLAAMFRSIGSNKYAVECIGLMYNLRYVWPPEYAYIHFICCLYRS